MLPARALNHEEQCLLLAAASSIEMSSAYGADPTEPSLHL